MDLSHKQEYLLITTDKEMLGNTTVNCPSEQTNLLHTRVEMCNQAEVHFSKCGLCDSASLTDEDVHCYR
jgi:hypothetical protein